MIVNLLIKNKNLTVFIALILIFSVSVAAYFLLKEKPEYNITRTLKYRYVVQNKTNKLLTKTEFWAYAPVSKTSNQLVVKLESSFPFKSEYDKYGNHIQTFSIDQLAPFATKIITITVTLKMSDKANPIKLINKQNFLTAEKNIESDNPKLISFAANLVKQSSVDTAQTLFNWVNKNIKYEGYVKNDRGALYAFNNRKGDCTEYSYLFTALSRTQSIATRVIGGYVYKEDQLLKPEDFHNWAEYYDNGRWIIADVQNANWNTKIETYIAFRILSREDNRKLGNSHRFAHSNPDVTMKLK